VRDLDATTRSLSQAKTLGGIGSILTLLLLVPFGVGAVLVIVGWILILLAAKDISDTVKDKSIFDNAIISVVLAIAATAVFASVVSRAFLGLIGLGRPPPTSAPFGAWSGLGAVAGIITGLSVAWILGVIASIFLWQSFKIITLKLDATLFSTAALIYIIGSILTVVLVGFLLNFIAKILFVIAFLSLPESPPGPATGPTGA